MARPRKSEPPLDYLRVRVPRKLKQDIETVVSFKETTVSAAVRSEINEYVERSYDQKLKGDDDPIFSNQLVKKRPRGDYCDDYIRFQLPLQLKEEFELLARRRGLLISVLLRLMVERYISRNSLKEILSEFQEEIKMEEAVVG